MMLSMPFDPTPSQQPRSLPRRRHITSSEAAFEAHSPQHPDPNHLFFPSSSSHLIRQASYKHLRFLRYLRRLLHSSSVRHRLFFLAIALTVLLAVIVSLCLSSRPASVPEPRVNGYHAYPPSFDVRPVPPESDLPSHDSEDAPEMQPVFNSRLEQSDDTSASDPAQQRPQTSPPPYHIESDMLSTAANLSSLPHTTWYFQANLHHFRPSRHRTTDARLITLNDACYCTVRNKFIIPKGRKHSRRSRRFPSFLYRYGSAITVSWKSPSRLLAFPSQKVVQFSGTTIFWRGRPLNVPGVHMHRSLVPIRSVIEMTARSHLHSDVKLLADAFEPPHPDHEVSKLHAYYFGDLPPQRLIELSRLRPSLLCFDRVVAFGSEYENHASSSDVYDHVKELIAVEEKGHLQKPLVKYCAHSDANKHTIWLMVRQNTLSSPQMIQNLPEVQTAIYHQLLQLGLSSQVTLRIVQAPHLVCPPGSAREGCYDLDCNAPLAFTGSDDCQRNLTTLHEVTAFNNMTFLLTPSGPATEALSYMPRGAHVVEMVPYGVQDHSHKHAAEDARLAYSHVEGLESPDSEQVFFTRFGDIARSKELCWRDFDCRAARLKAPVVVNVHQLSKVLKKALYVWRTDCGGQRL